MTDYPESLFVDFAVDTYYYVRSLFEWNSFVWGIEALDPVEPHLGAYLDEFFCFLQFSFSTVFGTYGGDADKVDQGLDHFVSQFLDFLKNRGSLHSESRLNRL